ncbi:hypothetical protein AB6A40_002977 [Gnathostoma spinigerum]|uniref:Uncharacterized protein n=1 Tax=Gnathostoma spinigerum TaxID=75299 RepID=A0ABD6E864_9BILA
MCTTADDITYLTAAGNMVKNRARQTFHRRRHVDKMPHRNLPLSGNGSSQNVVTRSVNATENSWSAYRVMANLRIRANSIGVI